MLVVGLSMNNMQTWSAFVVHSCLSEHFFYFSVTLFQVIYNQNNGIIGLCES